MTYVELPYFPLWAGDWLAGEATAMMLPEQEGAFIRLLCISWRAKDVPCSLPDDDKALAQMSRLRERWPELGPLVRDQFEVVNGRLRNAKLWAVFVESQERHAKHVKAGKKGGRPKPSLSPNKARPLAPPNQSESYTDTEETTTPPSGGGFFEELWVIYPKREGSNPKKQALSKYRARLREGVRHDEMRDGVCRYAEYCKAKDKTGTDKVMQAQRFFGTEKEFLLPWNVGGKTKAEERAEWEKRQGY